MSVRCENVVKLVMTLPNAISHTLDAYMLIYLYVQIGRRNLST